MLDKVGLEVLSVPAPVKPVSNIDQIVRGDVPVIPYSMYLENRELASPEDLISRLRHHVNLLESSFSNGQTLVMTIHLSGIDALVNGIKTYANQLPSATFASLFDEAG